MPTVPCRPAWTFYRFAWPVILAVLFLSSCSSDPVRDSLRQTQEKQRIIAALRSNLLLAVDAEKNALLSPSQAEAKSFLTMGQRAMADVRKEMGDLDKWIKQGGNAKEIAGLETITTDFKDLATLDATLSGLAGRNTNVRAAQLSRTEAALDVSHLQQVLTPIIDTSYCPASQEALRIVTAALSILALHAQHIDESTAAGMHALETAMNRQNERATAAFDRLSGLLPPNTGETLAQAKAAYTEFWQVTKQIIELSRQNTNIEATALSLGRKRLLTAKILADLAALETVVDEKAFTATR